MRTFALKSMGTMTVKELKIGEAGVVREVGGSGSLRNHFLNMGVTPGVEVKVLKRAPLGDPVEILVRGYALSLRLAEAAQITVDPLGAPSAEKPRSAEEVDFGYNLSLHEHNAHPGLGEPGKYHSRDHENPVPKGTVLTFALAGQQNSGKTTLFNALTGSNQHVGNFPGVTVDRKDGVIKGHPETCVTDLPGIYSLSTYTPEELVSRDFLVRQKPKAIINVIDANNIERNLYLTVQLMEMEIPLVLALNMMDELRGNGGGVRVNEMERLLGVPVVPIAAAKNEGIDELVEHALHIATYQEIPARQDFCSQEDHGGAVHRCIHGIMHLVEEHAREAGIPRRFAASRLIEGDPEIAGLLGLSENERETVEHLIVEMETQRGMDRNAAMADMRYDFIGRLCERTVSKPVESKERVRSEKIDKVLTGKWTAIPAFIAVLGLIFWLTFDVIGLWLQNLLDTGITWLGGQVDSLFVSWDISPAVRSLVVDAIFGGVGTVLSFLPIIVVLFFFL